jgi:hypothetical protein
VYPNAREAAYFGTSTPPVGRRLGRRYSSGEDWLHGDVEDEEAASEFRPLVTIGGADGGEHLTNSVQERTHPNTTGDRP